MPRLAYLLLSGEHPTIPAAEACAILEAERIEYRIRAAYDQLLILEAEPDLVSKVIVHRAAMVKTCGEVIYITDADREEILRLAREADWGPIRGRTYAVRIHRVKGSGKELSVRELEKEIGAIIHERTGSKVDLSNPEVLVQGVVTESVFMLGIMLGEVPRGEFDLRRPKRRPFFHPSAMEPRLARVFVNLSRAVKGEVFLDPFCGTGGFLIEAGLIGARPVGGDIVPEMVRGARLNLQHFGIKDAEVVLHDARRLPFVEARAIGADLPYGRSTTTLKTPLPEILERFLYEAAEILDRGSYMAIAIPLGIRVEEYAAGAGLQVVEEHRMRVHRSLTRRLVVLRKG